MATPLDVEDQNRLQHMAVVYLEQEEPVAKLIIKAHLDDMDTRATWKEITQCHKYSTTSTISSQKLSSYITSIRLEDGRWRGTQCNFIAHFKEQLRQHNDTSAHPYTDGQMIQFLNTAISGVEGLCSVLTLHHAAAAAAGTKKPIKMDEFVQLLLDQPKSMTLLMRRPVTDDHVALLTYTKLNSMKTGTSLKTKVMLTNAAIMTLTSMTWIPL